MRSGPLGGLFRPDTYITADASAGSLVYFFIRLPMVELGFIRK